MKLYVIVRSDIAPGLQAAQSCHALRLFAEEHPGIDREWYRQSNNLVVLAAESAEGLVGLARDLAASGVEVSLFREPDLGNEPTALAVAPAGSRRLRRLPLALRAA